MYQVKLINPLRQLGRISFDVLLQDDSGELPEVRLTKDFCVSSTRTQIAQKVNEMIASVFEERVFFGLDTELRTQDAIIPEIYLPEGLELPE
jgi:hypothetical protein